MSEGGTGVVHNAGAQSGSVRCRSSFDPVTVLASLLRSAHRANAHSALFDHRIASNPVGGARRSRREYVGRSSFGEAAMVRRSGFSTGFVVGTSNFRWSGRRVRCEGARVRALASQARHARTGRCGCFCAAAQL